MSPFQGFGNLFIGLEIYHHFVVLQIVQRIDWIIAFEDLPFEDLRSF